MFLLGVHRGQWDDSPATNLELREIRLPDETKTFNSVLMSQRRNMGNHFKEQMGPGTARLDWTPTDQINAFKGKKNASLRRGLLFIYQQDNSTQ